METTVSFPFHRLALAQLTATILSIGLWGFGTLFGGFGSRTIVVGVIEPSLVLVISLIFLWLFGPHKERPIASAATLWSASSFVRFAAALGVSCLLYYAAKFGARPIIFSFLLTAVLLLFFETKVIASALAKISSTTKV